MIADIKQSIFNKWKSHLSEPKNTDENGNEFYMCNGIKVVYVTAPSIYLWNQPVRTMHKMEKHRFESGYYILSTRKENYSVIEDIDALRFILDFDLTQKRTVLSEGQPIKRHVSLHDALYKAIGRETLAPTLQA